MSDTVNQTTNAAEEARWGQTGLHGNDCDPWHVEHWKPHPSIHLNGSYTPEQLRKLADVTEKAWKEIANGRPV